MTQFHHDLVFVAYGLAFFAMGLAVAVRAAAFPRSPFRRRLFALSAFGLIHGFFEWTFLTGQPNSAFIHAQQFGLSALSFLALLFFGLAERIKPNRTLFYLLSFAASAWIAAALRLEDRVALEVFTRLSLGIPAAFVVAHAFAFEAQLWPDRHRANLAARIGALAFVLYGALQLVSSPGDFFPASIFNIERFRSLVGVECYVIRAALGFIVFLCTMSLLNHFDDRLRQGADLKLARAHRALADSEASLKEAQRIGRIGSWEHDFRTNTDKWSDQTYRILGYEPGEIEPSSAALDSLIVPEELAAAHTIVYDSLAASRTHSHQARIKLPSGEERFVRWQTDIHRDAAGSPLKIVGTIQDVTELAKLQAASDEQHRLLREVLDGMAVFVGIISPEGVLIEANRAPIEELGLKREDTIGKPVWEGYWCSYSPQAQEQIRTALARAAQGETVQFDSLCRVKDDTFLTLDVIFKPVTDAQGRVVRIIGSGVDVSARVAADGVLKDTTRRLEDAQRLSETGSWEWSAATNKMTWSDNLFRIYGFPPHAFEPSRKAVLDSVHPDDRAFVGETISTAIARKASFAIDHRIVLPDESERVVHAQCQMELDSQGELFRILGVVRDVTEFRRVERALRDNQEMLSGVLNVAPEATIIADKDLNILMFSHGAMRTFGYDAEELIGSSIELLIPKRLHAVHEKHVMSFMKGHHHSKRMSERSELVGLRKNGEEFPAEASLSRLMTAHGPVYTVILRDITAQKAAKESLLQVIRAAQSANEAKSRFIANMSHELRTPLNAIIGFSEIMSGELYGSLGDERYLEYAKDIHSSGQHLLALINDILSVSRLEVGKTELRDDVALDIADLVRNSARWVTGRALEAGIELTSSVAPDMPMLQADSRLITQVLLNLLSNAVKFTPRGGSVHLNAEQDAHGGVLFSVRDTGIGMSAQEIAQIGMPFLQFDSHLSRNFEGTGLGLAITKRLVELHGGRLEIASELEKGTIATVTLPAARSVRRQRHAALPTSA